MLCSNPIRTRSGDFWTADEKLLKQVGDKLTFV
jgi:hypothetical protein